MDVVTHFQLRELVDTQRTLERDIRRQVGATLSDIMIADELGGFAFRLSQMIGEDEQEDKEA